MACIKTAPNSNLTFFNTSLWYVRENVIFLFGAFVKPGIKNFQIEKSLILFFGLLLIFVLSYGHNKQVLYRAQKHTMVFRPLACQTKYILIYAFRHL